MKPLFRSVILTVCVALATAGLAVPASAAETAPTSVAASDVGPEYSYWGAVTMSPQNWVRVLNPYVYRLPGWRTWHFKAMPDYVRNYVGETKIAEIKRAWAELLEAQITMGETLASKDGVSNDLYLDTTPTIICPEDACDHIRVRQKWFGFYVWMDRYAVDKIMAGVMTIELILGLIGGSFPAISRYMVFIAAALFYEAAHLWLCQNKVTKNADLYFVSLYRYTRAIVPLGMYCNIFS